MLMCVIFRMQMTLSTENIAPPKPTKSRNSGSSVSRVTNSNWSLVQFEFVPRNMGFLIWWISGCSIFSGKFHINFMHDSHCELKEGVWGVRSFVWHASTMSVAWLTEGAHLCDMSHSWTWHESLIRLTWHIFLRNTWGVLERGAHLCDMSHSCEWLDWRTWLTCLTDVSDMAH